MSSSNPFSLAGKVALITGAGRGIGEGIARAFVDAGAAVVLVARTTDEVERVAADITSLGGRALALPSDITDVSGLPGIVERTVRDFGRLDTVVNCAGGGDTWRAMPDNTVDELEDAFHFNVAAPFELVRLAVPHLLEQPGASVINIVSAAIHTPRAWSSRLRRVQGRAVLRDALDGGQSRSAHPGERHHAGHHRDGGDEGRRVGI